MPEQQKATPVRPPVVAEPDVIEVNMTTTYVTMGILSAATIGLTAVSARLWRRVREVERDVETLRAYTHRLVADTECGQVAYQNIVDAAEAEERGESIADVSDDFNPYPEEEIHTTDEPIVRVRRARDVRPNV